MCPYRLSTLVTTTLSGLSPIQTIMKMAEPENIKAMGVNPDELISFGGGWCNHTSPPALQEAYQVISNDQTLFHQSGRYSAILGSLACREQLARLENTIYHTKNITPDNILLGQSSTHLYHDLLRTINNPGDTILALDPTYANYHNATKIALPGSTISYLPALDTNSWTYLQDPESILEKLKTHCSKGARTLIIPSPDNPTSQIPSDQFLKGCLDILTDHQGYLILDCAYKALFFGEMPQSYQWSPNDHEHLILLHSNSKWLSSLGRRLGYVIAHPHLITGLEKLNESVLLSPDTLHSMTTATFLENSLNNGSLQIYIDETRELYRQTAKVLLEQFDNHLGWPRLTPQGGLYTVTPTPESKDPVTFVEELLKNTGVLLIPGKGFGPSMEHALRLSYGPLCYDHEKIKEGFERIGTYLS